MLNLDDEPEINFMDWLNVALAKGLEVYCNDTCHFVLIKILLQAIF